jgi:aryl-alcohol dehydrogenase-like predicted oxidoreductase
VTILEAATRLGLSVMISASLLQSQLTRLPETLAARIPGLATAAQRALQFVRSTPGVTTALVGMKTPAHAEENLALSRQPVKPETALLSLFDRTRK